MVVLNKAVDQKEFDLDFPDALNVKQIEKLSAENSIATIENKVKIKIDGMSWGMYLLK